MSKILYGQDFYNSQLLGSLQSAQVYLFHLYSIMGVPETVVDIGCGRGAWLATSKDFGVKRVVGVDGEWNSQNEMLDMDIELHRANLEQAIYLPEHFDLAISLEVAEHLRPESSDSFIDSLTRLSDVVLFGAAFVGQPGVNHINTRLHSFWARKFYDRGYLLFDLFRPTFWKDERVEPCYRQNTFLYVKSGHPFNKILVTSGYEANADAKFIDCVHPAIYEGLLNEFIRLQQAAATDQHEIPAETISDFEVSNNALPAAQETVEQLIESAQTQAALNRLGDAADSYRRALALDPDHPECLLRLSSVLMQMKCHEECLCHALHFLRIVDNIAFGYLLAGSAARELGHWQDARVHLLRAVELDPSHMYARVLCCMSAFTVCMDQAETVSLMRTYADELDQLVRSTNLETSEQINNAVDGIGALPPFFLPYLGSDVKELQVKYGSWVCSIMAAKYPQFSRSLALPPSNCKIKIGIVSNYFYNHSNWKIPIKGWLEQLDRTIFSIHCFHTGEISDSQTESARSLSESFLQSNDIDQLVSEIYGQNFNALIYPGIGMDGVTLKLAALRLAPVQCASWGHPVTTGMPTIDYFLSSDLMEPPEGNSNYSEKLVRLPNLSVWYEPAEQLVEINSGLISQWFKAEDIVFLCGQNLLKYLPQHDWVFTAIAEQVKNAHFVFIASYVNELTEKFIQRLDQAFQSRGMNVSDHVTVVPQLGEADFSTLNARTDIFLDSIEWSGCNTVFESLPYNKPIVTMPGAFMRGRHACAILTMMGVETTIADTTDEYISIAVRLAQNTQWRNDISAMIAHNKHKIFRDRDCIKGLEKFLRDVSSGGPTIAGKKCYAATSI